jgi:hypothetical protein
VFYLQTGIGEQMLEAVPDILFAYGTYNTIRGLQAPSTINRTLTEVLSSPATANLEVQQLMQSVTSSAVPPSSLRSTLRQGTVEKFLMPTEHVTVSYDNATSSGDKVSQPEVFLSQVHLRCACFDS